MTDIRPSRSDDSEEASAVITRCLREVNSRDYTPRQIERLCAEFTPEKLRKRFGESSFVAVHSNGEDEEVVGTATLRGDKLGSVFVRPDLHGCGIGKLLVLHVEEVAKGRGVAVIGAYSSLTALNFYLHLGYEEVDEKVEPDGEVTVRIRKQLL